MATKILIAGLPNSGKTSLLKTLVDVLVFARDNKNYPFAQPHSNVAEFSSVYELIDHINEKVETYKKKFGKLPKTIAIDSVSTISSEIEKNCDIQYSGFDIWKNVCSQMNALVDFINDIVDNGINVVLVTHAVWDETSKNYIEVCKGTFGKKGGFLSTVDYSIYVELNAGGKRFVTHKGKQLARCLLADYPDKQPVDDFNLQKYLDDINSTVHSVEEWSI